MIRLFITDLDGTLLKSENDYSGRISVANQEAIQRFVEAGHKFAIATSRPWDFRLTITPQLDCPFYYIGGNGMILGTREERFQNILIELDKAKTMYQLLQEAGMNCFFSVVDEADRAVGIGLGGYPLKRNQAKVIDRDELINSGWPRRFEEAGDAQFCGKIMVWTEPCDVAKTQELIREHFGAEFDIVQSDRDIVDITPKGIHKGTAVTALAKYLDIPLAEVAVIGDAPNDIAMFEVVPHSFCMAHADAATKNQARHIVGSVAEALDLISANHW